MAPRGAIRHRKATHCIRSYLKAAFHDTDTDILARILARMSVSVSWNAALNNLKSIALIQHSKLKHYIRRIIRAYILCRPTTVVEQSTTNQSTTKIYYSLTML